MTLDDRDASPASRFNAVGFEKVGSVSHHAKSTTLSPDEAINIVRGGLPIFTAVKTSGLGGRGLGQ